MSAASIQNKVAQMTKREYGLALGNATTGIYCAIQAAGFHGGNIAIPYNVCPNVVLAILFSGNTPVFVDIENETNGMDPSKLQLIADSLQGVIAVHSYGAICKIEEIRKICIKNSLFLIEDCAQAFGATLNGGPVGQYGNVTVFSFGRGKIIDVGYGGVVVTDDPVLYREMMRIADCFDWVNGENKVQIEEFNDIHTMFYNRFFAHDVSRFSFIFRTLASKLKNAVLQKFDETYDAVIMDAIEYLPQNLETRFHNAEILKSYCKKHDIHFFNPPKGSVFWRFNLYIKSKRDELLRALLVNKAKVSSWYPSVDQFFYETGDVRERELLSDLIGEEILNLWVNNEVPESYGAEMIEFIRTFLDGDYPSLIESPIKSENNC